MFNWYTLSLLAMEFILIAFLLVSRNPGYGLSVTLGFFVKGVLPVLALGGLAPFDKRDVRLVFITILVGGCLMALAGASWATSHEIWRLSYDDESSPITVARVIGLGATLLMLHTLLRPRLGPLKIITRLLVASVLLYIIALTGSRGPLVASILSVLVASLFLGLRTTTRSRLLLTLILALIVLTGSVFLLPARALEQSGIERIIDRFQTFGSNASDRTRLEMIDTAWEGFLSSSGLGVGTGGFATLYGVEGRAYPHNIVLEVAAGQGIVGLVVLVIILTLIVWRMVRLPPDHTLDANGKALLGLWFFALFNAFVSMDIVGNYFLWMSGGLVWLLTSPRPARATSHGWQGRQLSTSHSSSGRSQANIMRG
jgi:O-antigen ligase